MSASSKSFGGIQRRISISPLPASPVKSGEPYILMATREPPSSRAAEVCQHVQKEQELTVADA